MAPQGPCPRCWNQKVSIDKEGANEHQVKSGIRVGRADCLTAIPGIIAGHQAHYAGSRTVLGLEYAPALTTGSRRREYRLDMQQTHSVRSARRPALPLLVGVEMALVACTFLVFALLHVGVSVPGLSDRPIRAGAIAEAVLAISMAVAGAAVLLRATWAWAGAVAAHSLSVAGVLVGILAPRNGTTELNFAYHRVILAVLVAGLVLLLLPGTRAAFRRRMDSG
jgi:hypothetical protein